MNKKIPLFIINKNKELWCITASTNMYKHIFEKYFLKFVKNIAAKKNRKYERIKKT